MKTFFDLLPLIAFIIGILMTPFVNRIANNYRLKKFEEYFFDLIALLLEQIESQIPEIKNAISKCNNFETNDLTLTRITGHSLVNISKLNHEDLFKVFVLRKRKGNNTVDFSLLNKLIDFIDNVLPHIYSSNMDAIEKLSYYRNLWNESHMRFNNLYNQFISVNSSNGIQVGQDHYIDLVADILNSFSNKYGDQLQNIELGFNELTNPVIELSKINPQDQRSMVLLNELQKSKLYFHEIETVRGDHAKFLERSLKSIEKSFLELNELISKLNNKQNKFI